MQYENMYLKVIGNVHVILSFLKVLLLLKMLRRWFLVVLGWLNVYSRSQCQNKSNTYTYMQIIAKDKKQYIIT